MKSTANENLNLLLLKDVEVRDSQKEGGAPGGKRSKNPGAAMKKYKTPGERREKTQGQKQIEGAFIKKDMENVNKKISWTRFPGAKRAILDPVHEKPQGGKRGAYGSQNKRETQRFRDMVDFY